MWLDETAKKMLNCRQWWNWNQLEMCVIGLGKVGESEKKTILKCFQEMFWDMRKCVKSCLFTSSLTKLFYFQKKIAWKWKWICSFAFCKLIAVNLCCVRKWCLKNLCKMLKLEKLWVEFEKTLIFDLKPLEMRFWNIRACCFLQAQSDSTRRVSINF